MTGKTALRAYLRLQGAAGSEKVAMAAAAAAGHLAGLPGPRLADVQTAVSEACLNAFEHGNLERPSVPVLLTFTIQGRNFKVAIRDQGSGFQPAAVPKPDLSRQLAGSSSDRGWGLYLMRQLADRVQVRPGRRGCSVELYFHLNEEVTAS